jgi:hypothetical protein
MNKTNTWLVIMYPEGIMVGKIRSGRTRDGGKVRHVAFSQSGDRVGTYGTFREAETALQTKARES